MKLILYPIRMLINKLLNKKTEGHLLKISMEDCQIHSFLEKLLLSLVVQIELNK